MIKRIVIAGCRDFNDYAIAKKHIDFYIKNIKNKYKLVFVSGGCRGADMLGEPYARENNFKVERHNAEWEKYGKAAGPKRNEKMALISHYVICFWDGKSKGTKSMIEAAKRYKKSLKIIYI